MNTAEKKFCLQRNGYTLYSNNGDTSQRWFIFYYKNIGDIKKRVKLYGGINRYSTAEARYTAAIKFLDAIQSGDYQECSKFVPVKLQKLFDIYYEARCKSLRVKTKATYLSKINGFLEYCTSKKIDDLAKINKSIAQSFLDSIKKGPTTVNSYRDTLKMLFNDFKIGKLIEANPFETIKKLPESRRGKFPFSQTQVNQLKPVIKKSNPVLWMACQLEYYCFIRPGESRLLKFEYLNLEDHFIIIPADISKNKKTQTVCIPQAFESELKQWLKKVNTQNTYILNRQNTPLNPNKLNKWHKAILKKYGYSNRYSLYSWKHTGAVMAVKSGMNLKSLQLQIRHHSLDQLNEYLREMGVMDSTDVRDSFPPL